MSNHYSLGINDTFGKQYLVVLIDILVRTPFFFPTTAIIPPTLVYFLMDDRSRVHLSNLLFISQRLFLRA